MTLSIRDLDEIGRVVEEKIEEKLSSMPTKEEFYTKSDQIMSEIKAIREEHRMLSSRVYDNHEPRIEKIEKKLSLSV